ncbi:MAG: hypothetical protein DRP35_08880 [Candidatus Zixiibacteriota bacterium]|nr:MAG: hypothetical protein DRP35_08880 [candidate division Zixibacteria bacterium]
MDKVKQQIKDILTQPLALEDCYISDLVLSKYKNNSTLRLFVYAKDNTSLDECARISRIVGDVIDGTDLFKKGYTLEVSSPGLDKPLKSIEDFEYRTGETVKIVFCDKNKKKIMAKIISANGNLIEFESNEGRFICDLAEIENAKIVF